MNALNLPYLLGDLSSVSYIWLTLTNQCNIHCKYCFNYVYRNYESMPDELAVSIVNKHLGHLEAGKQQRLHVIYFGGEPTVNDRALIASIDCIKNHNISSQLDVLTNGLIKPSVLEALLLRRVTYQISFDGVHNSVRYFKHGIKDASQETIKCIKRISQHGGQIRLRSTIHQNNVTNMPDLITFCSQYGIPSISFAPICMFGDSKVNSMRQPSIDEYVQSMRLAIELGDKLNINIELRGEAYFNKLSTNKMKIPFVWLPDGKVAMTITYASSKIPGADSIIIGEYSKEHDSIILNEAKIQQMNRNFQMNRAKYCTGCPLEQTCRGLIHFTPFATNTFIEERDRYFCNLAVSMSNAFPA